MGLRILSVGAIIMEHRVVFKHWKSISSQNDLRAMIKSWLYFAFLQLHVNLAKIRRHWWALCSLTFWSKRTILIEWISESLERPVHAP